MPRLLGRLRWDLVLVALILGTFRGILTGDVIWMRDLPRWVVPSRHALRESLARGELPRWDHFQGIGVPLPANPLHGLFYPPTALSLLEPLAWWTNAFLLAHILFGAVGFARLARRSGVSSEGAALTGVAWALSGPVLSELTAGIRLPSIAWAPWIALGLIDLCASPQPRTVPRLAVPLGLALLAGEPFMVLFGVLFAVVALPASEAWPPPPERRARLPALLACSFVGVALGALLAAVAYAPVLGALAGTQRASALAAPEALAGSLPLARLLDQVMPGGYAEATLTSLDPEAQRVTGRLPLLYWHYLGASVFALALVGLRRDRRSLAWGAALLLALVLAMGEHTPLYGLAQALVPPLRRMRAPEKFLGMVVMASSLMAGAGYDALRAAPKRALRAAPVALVLLGVLASRFASPALTETMHGSARRALLGLALLAPLPWVLTRASSAAPWLALLAVALDLGRMHGFAPMWAPLALTRAESPLVGALRQALPRVDAAPLRVYRAQSLGQNRYHPANLPPSIARFASLPPNLGRVYGVGMVPAYDVAASPALDRILAVRRLDSLRLLSVDAALQPPRDRDAVGGRRLVRVFDTVDVLAVEGTLPRVYAVGRAQPEAVTDPGRLALRPELLRGEVAVVPPGSAALDGAAARAGECSVRSVRNGRIEASCELTREALVVFVEQHAPGWSALVDGRPTSVVATNGLVLGVRAPAGRRRIELRYDPPGLRVGVALSAFGALALTFLARRRGARGPTRAVLRP